MLIYKPLKIISRNKNIQIFIFITGIVLHLGIKAADQVPFNMIFDGGVFYGPGNMPDVLMPSGSVSLIYLENTLNGYTPYFNNASKKPNIATAKNNSFWADGKLSNGVSYNENMEGGIVDIGEGALSLFTVVSSDGSLKGRQLYRLDQQCNWNVITDLALDPGFKEGIIFAKNLTITTGVEWVPLSLQTQQKFPGGTDKAGSLHSLSPIIGNIGDYNNDGMLDGAFVGVANIPLDHIFYPGAAVVQSRSFKTNIPVSVNQVSMLTLANLLNYISIFENILEVKNSKELKVHYVKSTEKYLKDISQKLFHVANKIKEKNKNEKKILKIINEIEKLDVKLQSAKDENTQLESFTHVREIVEFALVQLMFVTEIYNDIKKEEAEYCQA